MEVVPVKKLMLPDSTEDPVLKLISPLRRGEGAVETYTPPLAED